MCHSKNMCTICCYLYALAEAFQVLETKFFSTDQKFQIYSLLCVLNSFLSAHNWMTWKRWGLNKSMWKKYNGYRKHGLQLYTPKIYIYIYSKDIMLYTPKIYIYILQRYVIYSQDIYIYSKDIMLYTPKTYIYSKDIMLYTPKIYIYSKDIMLYTPKIYIYIYIYSKDIILDDNTICLSLLYTLPTHWPRYRFGPSPVGWSCRIYWLHLCKGVTPPPTCVLGMTQNNLMVGLQSRALGSMEYSFIAIALRLTLTWCGSIW